MRWVAVLASGIVLGFGAGWLAFDWPFGGSSSVGSNSPVTQADAESAARSAVEENIDRKTTGNPAFFAGDADCSKDGSTRWRCRVADARISGISWTVTVAVDGGKTSASVLSGP